MEFTDKHLRVLRNLLREPDAEVSDAEFLDQGWTNENFKVRLRGAPVGEELVLRVCPPATAELAERRRVEMEVLAGVAQDLAPTVLGYELPAGHLLTRFVSGPLLEDAPPAPEELGGNVAGMHRKLGSMGRQYDPRGRVGANLLRATRAGHPAPGWVAETFAGLPETEHHTIGCHNDFNPWNVIRGDQRWYVLDWETAADNDPLFDLVCMFEGLCWDETQRAQALGCYFDRSELALPSVDQVRTATLLFRLGEYAWAHAQKARGNPRSELEAQLTLSLGAIAELR